MNRAVASAVVALLLASAPPVLAQSAEEKARIDYEAAKLALEQKKPALALEKLEKVIATLGQLPDLLYVAADAALQAGKVSRAKELVGAAFAASDAAFKKTPEYKGLIALAARIEVQGPMLEAVAKGYWVDDSSKLMWTVKDNGSGISGNGAIAWCRSNRTGGFSDWRQPSIEELAGIYDPSINEQGKAKIKAPIELSSGGFWVWSGTAGSKYGSTPSAWLFLFIDGSRDEFYLVIQDAYLRALCVRRSGD